jgi:hypothetical protein
METITIDFNISGLEISTDNRWELSQTIDKFLQDSGGRWVGYRYTKDMITIHAVMQDEEKTTSVIRSAIKGQPVFTYIGHHPASCANIR